MSALVARARALVALDGPLATTVVAVFAYFTVSVSYLACLVPLFAFTGLVGWQATHLAVWLSAASLLPVAPATFALLRASRLLLAERGEARAVRAFWAAFAEGCRRLWWAAASLSLLVVLLQYDLALFEGSDAVLLLVGTGAALAAVLLVGVCVVSGSAPTVDERVSSSGARAPSAQRPEGEGAPSAQRPEGEGAPSAQRPGHQASSAGAVETLTAAATAIARRPHIALSWLLLIGVGLAATAIPLLGPALALFLPALLGAGIHICNDALRLIPDETSSTS
ncbi:hypothetical protein JNB62_10785 [Microbacterium jejuense]|uniref:DUF624 domain-containing protein n=1 Tax=Microbacterium jejuense TaxID=1263637 RepID=A0ABS7HP13_9MICO|nr:hypothetical protein [Microbacterium jejuense]MBW9094169.1 hypothetical protein [Microbacterium jejuense]